MGDAGEIVDLTGEVPGPRQLTVTDLAGLVEEMAAYYAHFAPLFGRWEHRGWAKVYLRGLLLADVPRKNIEAMVLRLLGAEEGVEARVRALQQFVGEGRWEDAAIVAEHQRLVDQTLGEDEGVLIVDGSDVAKRGSHSMGVARQWCGATGKTDNCQAGVYLGYASRHGYTLLDRRLYLPREWFGVDHQDRWEACRIPEGTPFRTKSELAADLVEAVVAAQRVRARWVVCDEWFGRNSGFLDRIAATGLDYLANVPKDTAVWPLMEPTDGTTPRRRATTAVPPRAASGKGRPPTTERLHPDSPPPLRVDELATHLSADQWHRYRIREGSKGPLVAEFAAVRAVAVRHGLPGPEVWVVVHRTLPPSEGNEQPVEVTYTLSSAPLLTPLATLVRISGMRWPIEACFEEGKGEVGLDHYELRSWRGWHHHMTFVLLAHHFLVRMQRHLDQRGGGATNSQPTFPARCPRIPWSAWMGCPRTHCHRRSHPLLRSRSRCPKPGDCWPRSCPCRASTRPPRWPW